ncbi:hypothetical protein D9758_012003 [Tetrapyrgos nigripes]|uniref:Uncharacterized protein n=1 Tax=Tetrapyrgos nigripes TaxID=182062 RepID=A0A8H5FR25_9AGAR|nr:hypothetical protein D9758_012003 [Tetrapyrgos nigripes]
MTVLFFGAGWEAIGSKRLLKLGISRLTGIPPAVLGGSRPIEDIDIQERMTWCAGRQTTRPPDLAYCLLGILGVSMTPDYSEDAKTAFKRLQIALVQSYPDRFKEFKGDDIYTMLLSQNMCTRVQSGYNDSSFFTSIHSSTTASSSSPSLDKDSLSPLTDQPALQNRSAWVRLSRPLGLLSSVISTSTSSNSLPAPADTVSRETDNRESESRNVSNKRFFASHKVSFRSGLMSPDLKYAAVTRSSHTTAHGRLPSTSYPVSQPRPPPLPLPRLPAPTNSRPAYVLEKTGGGLYLHRRRVANQFTSSDVQAWARSPRPAQGQP